MAFEKRYKTIVPVPRPGWPDSPPDRLTEMAGVDEHEDYRTARWLARESFEKTMAGDRLKMVEYEERLVPLEDVDPRLADSLGPLDQFEWFEFSGLGRLDQDMFDWFAAEFRWQCDEWLAAEKAHLDAIDAGGA